MSLPASPQKQSFPDGWGIKVERCENMRSNPSLQASLERGMKEQDKMRR